MPTLEERIKACMEKHQDWDDARVANAIVGSGRAAVRAVREGRPVEEHPGQEKPVVGVITLDAVRARYDIAAAIKRELAKLKPGALILETEMRQRAAGRDANRFRRTVDNAEEFKANRIKLQLDPDGGEAAWYWGDNSTIAAAIKVRDSV
jgi:hypothetical protein